jgi:hypothetical protein
MYKIIRRFFNDHPPEVIETGLTLKAAQKHCKNPENSSHTATGHSEVNLTKRVGPWFDSYEKEEE